MRSNISLQRAMSPARKALAAVLVLSALLFMPSLALSSDITTLTFRQVKNDIIINTSLQFDQKMIDDLNTGLSKEIVFSIDLFRRHKLWPNESVTGRSIVKILQSNPIKREYVGTSIEGNIKTVKRFRDISSMIAWGVHIEEFRLENITPEPDGDYFIRVAIESRLHTMPAVVGYILFFLPTREFSVSRETPVFKLSMPTVAK
jgi:hypothetical protein